MVSNKIGWHSGTLTAQNVKVRGDVTIQDDLIFSDVSAGTLGVTGGIDMTGTTQSIGISMSGGTFSTAAIQIGTSGGITSSISNSFVPFILSAALSTTTDTAAVSVANYFTRLVTTTASIPTLANGSPTGQLKKIQFITDVGDAVLTPANLNDGTTITFADIGDTAELIWDGSGWQVLALYNTADGTTAPVLA